MSGKPPGQAPGICRGEADRRSGSTQVLQGWESPSSKHHKWARKRAAAEASRIENKRRETARNRPHPVDFAARAPPRAMRIPAMPMCPLADRRSSVNRSPCGRRTSVRKARRRAAFTPISIRANELRKQAVMGVGIRDLHGLSLNSPSIHPILVFSPIYPAIPQASAPAHPGTSVAP